MDGAFALTHMRKLWGDPNLSVEFIPAFESKELARSAVWVTSLSGDVREHVMSIAIIIDILEANSLLEGIAELKRWRTRWANKQRDYFGFNSANEGYPATTSDE
ncbi:hypothetical protein FRC18_008658 [Serendipita sp. 400]|nr:hypothetical protein FRC18_008658 [Serendipita sp. 400]